MQQKSLIFILLIYCLMKMDLKNHESMDHFKVHTKNLLLGCIIRSFHFISLYNTNLLSFIGLYNFFAKFNFHRFIKNCMNFISQIYY